jgi:hypothetical protein
VEGEILINAAKAGDEVIFERTDGSCGGIVVMHARRDELEVDIFGVHEILEWLGAFVVEALRLGSKASSAQGSM